MPTLTREQALLWVRDCQTSNKHRNFTYMIHGLATKKYILIKKSIYLGQVIKILILLLD